MKEVYLKITIAILFILCAVLTGNIVLLNSKAYMTQTHISKIEAQNEDLVKKIRKPSEHFYFMTKNQARTLGENSGKTADSQIIFEVPEKDKAIGKKLADTVKEKTPAQVRDVFLAYLAESKEEPVLYVDQTQHLLKDRDTVILEEMCMALGMKADTKLCWDMHNQERICISTVAVAEPDPAKKENEKNKSAVPGKKIRIPAVSFSYRRRNADLSGLYCQDGIHTVVLGFNPITLSGNSDKELTRPYFQIPLGGHYTHLIEVRRSEDSNDQYWYLEYEVPHLSEKNQPAQDKNKNPEQQDISSFHINAISLIPGSPVISISSGNIQTFRVPFVNGTSRLLISADHIVFPKSLIASPHHKNSDAFGK